MISNMEHGKIYRRIVDILEHTTATRRALISGCITRFGLSASELADTRAGSRANKLRSKIGSVINEMEDRGLIARDTGDEYYLTTERPVVIRVERCEREMIRALSEGAKTKAQLRDVMRTAFGTDKTASTRDDDTLSTYMGQILKKLVASGILEQDGVMYTLSERATAHSDNINELLRLKSEFIQRLYTRGGEFFENYFMTLLGKYAKKRGYKVIECYVTGGSSDGGIDGVMITEDSLGFRETTMVQTKNRTDMPDETDVRGFYGAVCAKRGTRGIYVTTADFHAGATAFLDPLDDCVGVNGTKIFELALECSYGVKKQGDRLTVDEKII